MLKEYNSLHRKASRHCALCRERLPEPQYEPLVSEAWEYKILGICDGSDTNMPLRTIAILADLTDPEAFSELSVISTNGRRPLEVAICLLDQCPRCEVDKVIHLVHLSCWKLSNISKTNHTTLHIYKFARSTYPLFENPDIEDRRRMPLGFASTVIEESTKTETGRLLNCLSRLPAEIQLAISTSYSRNLLSSLLIVSQRSSPLLSLIEQNGLCQSISRLRCNTSVHTVYANSINIFGESYITLLRFNESGEHDTKDQNLILVKRSGVKGVKFVLGCYGVRAISILYANNSTSAWLGDATSGWNGVMYGDTLRSLRVIRDDLKYLRVDLVEKETRPIAMPRVMWDRDLHFSSTQSHRILDSVDTHLQIHNFPGWRLCRYLPFVDDGGHISGLTVYCDHHSITGMIAHAESIRLIGHRQGCPIHFHFRHDERITSVWLRTPGDTFSILLEPTILVTTSRNRTCIFGPYLSRDVIHARQYGWTNLSKHPEFQVIGMFYDTLSVSSSQKIMSIGITGDTNSGNAPVSAEIPSIPAVGEVPIMGGTIATGLFVSKGTLTHVERLEVRKVGSRCTGLCIYHSDEVTEVLGQWDPSQRSLISEIYNAGKGTLTTITFRFSGPPSSSYVDDIIIGIDDAETPEGSQVGHSKTFHISQQPVAWWFTASYDEVVFWNGRSEGIASNFKHRVMDLV